MCIVSDDILPPYLLYIAQAPPVANVVAQDNEVWIEKRVILRRSGVVEFKTIRTIVHADVVDERLV